MKYFPHNMTMFEAIRAAVSPTKAAELGRDRSFAIRPDWESSAPAGEGWETMLVDDGRGPERAVKLIKDKVMFEVVLAKFSQHAGLKSIILGTGDLPLVENAIHDPYWGIGSSKNGVNRLGKVLMGARIRIRELG